MNWFQVNQRIRKFQFVNIVLRLPVLRLLISFVCVFCSVITSAQNLGNTTAKPSYWQPQYVVDLSYDLHEGFPWIPVPGITFPFKLEPMVTIEQAGVAANKWHIHEHLGTQIDAPSHFAEGGRSVDQLRPDELFAPIVVINFKNQARSNPDAELRVEHILDWESQFGKIPERSIVIMNSGWGDRIESQESFVNMDDQGTKHFPGFSEEATIWLVEQRDIWGLGVDTISFDPGYDNTYKSHKALESRDRWAIEAMANLDKLPPIGATLIVGAVNVRGATGGLVRPIAVWSDSELPENYLPQLSGNWESRSPEKIENGEGSPTYLVRRFTFDKKAWSVEFDIYADQTLSQLLLTGYNSGSYHVHSQRLDDGSFHTDFKFEERKLTPRNKMIAQTLSEAKCGNGNWLVGESQNVHMKGCESFRVYPKSKCETEYDVVRMHAGRLYLGERPKDGFMCHPSVRPELSGSHPLVQAL